MMKALLDGELARQVLRYGLVGLVVLACDFATYALVLAAAPSAYLPANLCGKLVGAMTGFVLHRKVTFSWRQRDGAVRQLLAYIAVLAGNLLLSSLLLWLLVGRIGVNEYAAKLAVDVVVIASAFIFSRLWVYRPA